MFLLCSGCGGSSGAPGGEHDKVMGEAIELSMKIFKEQEKGKDVATINREYEKQIADIDARIEKLPPLTSDQSLALRTSYGSRFRTIDEKMSAAALKGPIPKLPNYLLIKEEDIEGK